MDVEEIARLERIMLATWPPLETAERSGWVLGANGGFTGRANSLTVIDHHDGDDIADLISWMEAWYRDRGAVPAARITPISTGVGAALERTAYGWWRPGANVMAGDLGPLCAAAVSHGYEVVGAATADDAWLDVSGHDEFGRSVLSQMYDGVAPASFHATVTRDGEAVAIGRGVVADGHLAIYGMETVPEHRRRGLARTVIGALARWAADQGATRTTLQVEVGNDGAHALYERMGLSDIYEYSYLAREAGGRLATSPP